MPHSSCREGKEEDIEYKPEKQGSRLVALLLAPREDSFSRSDIRQVRLVVCPRGEAFEESLCQGRSTPSATARGLGAKLVITELNVFAKSRYQQNKFPPALPNRAAGGPGLRGPMAESELGPKLGYLSVADGNQGPDETCGWCCRIVTRTEAASRGPSSGTRAWVAAAEGCCEAD